MHPDKQRIKIAEICGWNDISEHEMGYICGRPGFAPGYFDEIPDYLRDLNAMHEAEKRLIGYQIYAYSMNLKSMILTPILGEDSNNLNDILLAFMRLSFVTAAQKAEAFLKTFGEWEEDDN